MTCSRMQRFWRATATCAALSSSIVAAATAVEHGPSAHALSAVDTLSDNPADGYTLREAIADANAMVGPDDIVFAQGLTGTIDVSAGTLLISDSLSIVGPEDGRIQLSGGDANRVITAGAAIIDLSISHLSIRDGAAAAAGGGLAFVAAGSLSLTDVTFQGNAASTMGGALFVSTIVGDVVLDEVYFNNGGADTGGGAAIQSIGGDLEMNGGRFWNNFAQTDGGGMFASDIGGDVELDGVDIDGNTAAVGIGGGVIVDGVAGDARLSEVSFGFSKGQQGGGGGVAGVAGSIDADGLTVRNNEAIDHIGGVRLQADGDISVANTSVVDNEVLAGDIGGLHVESGGDIRIEQSMFERNLAPDGSAGALWANADDDVTLSDLSVADNSAEDFGGGVLALAGSNVSISGSTFTRNTVDPAFGAAGAAFVSAATSNVVGSQFDSNTAALAGAMVNDVTGDAVIRSSTFAHNEAGVNGGAIFHTSPAQGLLVSTSTFSGNEATGTAGAIMLDATSLTVEHSTFADNAAAGPHATFDHSGASDVSYEHSVFAGNRGMSTDDLSTLPVTAREYSLFASTTGILIAPGSNLDGVDAKLLPLADNGGTTTTHLPRHDSPAVDAGDPGPLITIAADQRGEPRQVGRIDMGAVEVQVDERPLWLPVTPARVVDTRPNGATVDGLVAAGGVRPAESTIAVDIAGRADVPDDARGVIVNVTAVQPTSSGFLTTHACLDETPNTSSLNFTAGVNLGNEVFVDLDDGGAMCIFTEVETHVTVDVVAFVPAMSPLVSLTPGRFADSRSIGVTLDGASQGFGRTEPGSTMVVPLSGRGAVPADTAAVVVNLTAVGPRENGYVTAHECLMAPPDASSLNHAVAVNRGNEIVVQPDDDGNICVFTSQAIHFTVDVVAYVPAGADLSALAPVRLLDTRTDGATIDGESLGGGVSAAGQIIELAIAGRGGIATGSSGTVVVNVTAVAPAAAGFVTVWNCVDDRPLASSLNYVAGVNGGNQLVASLPSTGSICLFTSAATHITADVSATTSVT